jgi:6-phosphogluconolactonase
MSGLIAYVGTQGERPGEGIHAVSLDPHSGSLTDLGVVAEEERPTWVMPDPVRPVLYSVSEVGNRDDRFGAIMSYEIRGPQGGLRPLSRRRTDGGPTHLVLNTASDMLYCANFGGPTAVAVPIIDGVLQPIQAVMTTEGTGPHRRQTKPHPHGVTLDPSGQFLLVPDMGADRVFVYRVEGQGLVPHGHTQCSAGCGPRFVLFGKDGSAYMVAELSAEVFHYRWDDQSGTLTMIARIALDDPSSTHSPGAAAFGISSDGRFLYVSNRGSHDMQVFSVDAETGSLTEVQRISSGGEKPWGLGLSACGGWMLVANQADDCVVSFAIDPDTGKLSPSGHSLKIRMPTSAAFAPTATP